MTFFDCKEGLNIMYWYGEMGMDANATDMGMRTDVNALRKYLMVQFFST